MFGWNKKQRQLELQVKELSTAAKALMDALQTKIELLESRQKQLRDCLKAAIVEPIPIPKQTMPGAGLSSLPVPADPGTRIVDHACVDSDFNVTGNSDICIYCHPDLRNHD